MGNREYKKIIFSRNLETWCLNELSKKILGGNGDIVSGDSEGRERKIVGGRTNRGCVGELGLRGLWGHPLRIALPEGRRLGV